MCDVHYPFIQATHFTRGRIKPPRLIVVHDMEVAQSHATAESVASHVFAGPNARRASAHFNVDQDSIVQSVKVGDTAWAAPNANADGIHIEHAGFARQSRDQWLREDMMLNISAAAAAELVTQFWIPPNRLTLEQIRDGKTRGFCGHIDITNAFHTRGGHTDPGNQFPWDVYLNKVKWFLPHVKGSRRFV